MTRPGGDLVAACRERSLALLRANTTPRGVIAAARSRKAVDRRYANIFGRDAAICALGMVVSGDPGLERAAVASLLTLGRRQAANGQIPKYVPEGGGKADFWYSGCIDATLWWLLAVDFVDHALPAAGLRARLVPRVAVALAWLSCQEHPGMHLLQQNEASDWADIMPRSGFVLYSNALWYAVQRRFGVGDPARTRHFARHIFFPFGKPCPRHRRARTLAAYVVAGARERRFWLSHVNFAFWGEEVDVLGNVLACLVGLPRAPSRDRILDALLERGANSPYPVRSVLDPLRPGSCRWRPYMDRHGQNRPWQYHNGGIWPFAAGFWVLLLAARGRRALAARELVRYAEACRAGRWGFCEWLHGRTGKPSGMRGQSWNAGMFLLAEAVLRGDPRVPPFP